MLYITTQNDPVNDGASMEGVFLHQQSYTKPIASIYHPRPTFSVTRPASVAAEARDIFSGEGVNHWLFLCPCCLHQTRNYTSTT